jgi:hypothetical protein
MGGEKRRDAASCLANRIVKQECSGWNHAASTLPV